MKEVLLSAIPHLAGRRVIVIGDLILDEYLTGTAARLSREAPIPVLEFEARQTIPGGAANPAMNIAALGGRVTQIGLVGADEAGEQLVTHLKQAGIETGGIVIDANRTTTQKTRLMAQGSLRFPQQVARLDRIERHPPEPAVEATLIDLVTGAVRASDAIIVSDYRNGLLTPALVAAVKTEATRANALFLADSQGQLDKYAGYGIIRANQHDTELYLGRSLTTEIDFQTASAELLQRLEAGGIVIGRGAEGVSLQGKRSVYHHFEPANVTEVFDVTGAGDTSIAVLALGLTAGLELAPASLLANYAAGLVVQKLGNVTLTPAELEAAIRRW